MFVFKDSIGVGTEVAFIQIHRNDPLQLLEDRTMFKKPLILLTGLLIVGFAQNEAKADPIMHISGIVDVGAGQFQFDFSVENMSDGTDFDLFSFDVQLAPDAISIVALVAGAGWVSLDFGGNATFNFGFAPIVIGGELSGFSILAQYAAGTTTPIIPTFSFSDPTGADVNGVVTVPEPGTDVNGVVTVPEPGTMLLFGAGLMGLALSRRRRKI